MLQPWERWSAEFGEDAVELVEAEEVLLPLTNAKAAVVVQRKGAGVSDMAVAAGCGLLIRRRVKIPVSMRDVTKLGFVPGQVCLNPSGAFLCV